MDTGKVKRITRRILRIFFLFLGILSFVMLVLAFTRIPYDVQVWLGTYKSHYRFQPDEIILLGGSGMPSEANLIRIYHSGVLMEKYPAAGMLIAHPKDESVIDEIRRELIQRSVDSTRIRSEKNGTSTREQAVQIAEDFPELLNRNIVLVTSPENMLRSVQTFRKAGFRHVGGHSAFELAMFVDLAYDFKKAGGKVYSPDVSGNLALRYNFWNYLKLEITCLREFFALGYYKLNGWI